MNLPARLTSVRVIAAVATLLLIQAGLLAYSATQHSPTLLEPAQLSAGIHNWRHRRFELFRVNPPLVRMIAALPVIAVGCETDWRTYHLYDGPDSRPEFAVGWEFVKANGPRSLWLFNLARWACIPITLLGGLFCCLWATELSGRAGCGLLALALWCFEPNILGHGELISNDAAATAFGIGAAYLFWRWLKRPNWNRAFAAGLLLGLAQLAKMNWLFLFALWPVLWLFWCGTDRTYPAATGDPVPPQEPRTLPSLTQLTAILLLGVYVLNLGYAFDGTFTRHKEFTFVSRLLTGAEASGRPGNRFADSRLGDLPVPLPKQYLLGLDVQRRDLEDYRGEPSYLRGEWKHGGWWYYYLYGLAVKTTHGHQILLALSALAAFATLLRDGENGWRDGVMLAAPPLFLLVTVSAHLEFNHYVRYVLPVIGFSTVAAGFAYPAGAALLSTRTLTVAAALAWSVAATVWNYPHQLAYFNEAAGRPTNGHGHLVHDGFDLGQDLLFADRLRASLGEPEDVAILYFGAYRADEIGIMTNTPVRLPLAPGTYIVSATPIVRADQRRALGGSDPEGALVEALSRYPCRRIEGCTMLVVTVPEKGERS